VGDAAWQLEDAAFEQFHLLVVSPDQRGPADQHEHLVLTLLPMLGRSASPCLTSKLPTDELPVGRLTVSRRSQRAAVEPFEFLLLFGLRQVHDAHRISSFSRWVAN